MFSWLSISCCSNREKQDKPLNCSVNTLTDIKLIDESTMFPSNPYQDLSEHLPVHSQSASNSKSNPTVSSISDLSSELKDAILSENLEDDVNFYSCTVCKKPSQGFCCACIGEKYCEFCFKSIHSNLPRFHIYFPFKPKKKEGAALQKLNTLTRRKSRLQT